MFTPDAYVSVRGRFARALMKGISAASVAGTSETQVNPGDEHFAPYRLTNTLPEGHLYYGALSGSYGIHVVG